MELRGLLVFIFLLSQCHGCFHYFCRVGDNCAVNPLYNDSFSSNQECYSYVTIQTEMPDLTCDIRGTSRNKKPIDAVLKNDVSTECEIICPSKMCNNPMDDFNKLTFELGKYISTPEGKFKGAMESDIQQCFAGLKERLEIAYKAVITTTIAPTTVAPTTTPTTTIMTSTSTIKTTTEEPSTTTNEPNTSDSPSSMVTIICASLYYAIFV